jgi:hypothetical protein
MSPDITMCSGEGCRLKKDCYRHVAQPKPYRQSYFVEPPCAEKGTKCKHFWEVESKSQLKRFDAQAKGEE